MTSLQRRKLIIFLIGTPVLVLLDQATKLWIKYSSNLYDSLSVFGNIVRFTYIHNSGGVFGTRLGGTTFYLVFAIIALLIVLLYFFREVQRSLGEELGFVLIIGGAFGNLIDRIYMSKVVDFIDVGFGRHRWPTFNVADAAITIGIIVVIIFQIKETLSSDEERKTPDTSAPED